MGILDVIKRMQERKKVKSEKFKQMQEDYRLNKILEDRQKSSNERELERYMKEQRETKIKQELDKIHNKQNHENWKGNTLTKGATILKTDRPILKEKNIFMDNRNDIPFTQKGGMFFKW